MVEVVGDVEIWGVGGGRAILRGRGGARGGSGGEGFVGVGGRCWWRRRCVWWRLEAALRLLIEERLAIGVTKLQVYLIRVGVFGGG